MRARVDSGVAAPAAGPHLGDFLAEASLDVTTCDAPRTPSCSAVGGPVGGWPVARRGCVKHESSNADTHRRYGELMVARFGPMPGLGAQGRR